MDNITTLRTEKVRHEERVAGVVAALNNLSGELSTLTIFGKCKDGTFVTLTANALDPASLGYSQAQLTRMSQHFGDILEMNCEEIELE